MGQEEGVCKCWHLVADWQKSFVSGVMDIVGSYQTNQGWDEITLRRRCEVARKMVLYCMCRKGRSYETTEGFGLVKHRPQGPTEGTPQ